MRLLLSSLFLLLASACVGIGDESPGGDDDTPGDKMGPKVFKADVHPLILKCGSVGCHETTAQGAAISKFYASEPTVSYDATINSPLIVGTFSAIAPLITHIEAGHKNLPNWTPDEKSKILNWLSVETEERKGTTPTPMVDPKQLLKDWSGCMSLANFETAQMTQKWGTLAGTNQALCRSCHQTGLGFYIGNPAQNFFDIVSKTSGFLLKYVTVNTQEGKVVINNGAFESANKIKDHPLFPVTTNAGYLALQQFYELTNQRKAAGQCDPPRLLD
jgi:hypothetical protein